MNNNKHAGFSLVELSIVLVILGLLTGGILTGQSLIKAAELRAITTEYSNYQTAVNTFRQKYFALPGDMSNATSFWGDDNAVCADAAIANGTPGTCNGSANGQIVGAERYRFWQHLALAGIIEGSYTGTGAGETHILTGTTQNTPKSKFSNAGWNVHYATAATDFGNAAPNPATDYYTTNYGGNIFEFGSLTASNRMTSAALIPEEAWNIDTKMDDGRPGQGRILARLNPGTSPCATGAVTGAATSTYELSATAVRCALIFKGGM